MKQYQVEGYKMHGGELDVFYKLFWFGSQEDGGLPCKSGMDELINKGLAVKNYKMPELFPGEEANGLTIKGAEVARRYYHKKYRGLRDGREAELPPSKWQIVKYAMLLFFSPKPKK